MSVLISTIALPSGQSVVLYQGDLTEETVDAIVNTANAQLAHGGGVAGAIVRRGGREIQVESDEWVRAHGQAGHAKPALTGAGKLHCRFVIHAVGPVGGTPNADENLRAAYASALELAHAHGFTSVAFPSISTGIFGFPVARAAPIALRAALDFCAAHPGSPLREIRFTIIDSPTVAVFTHQFEKIRTQ